MEPRMTFDSRLEFKWAEESLFLVVFGFETAGHVVLSKRLIICEDYSALALHHYLIPRRSIQFTVQFPWACGVLSGPNVRNSADFSFSVENVRSWVVFRALFGPTKASVRASVFWITAPLCHFFSKPTRLKSVPMSWNRPYHVWMQQYYSFNFF